MLKETIMSAVASVVLSGVAFAGVDLKVNVGVPAPPVVVEQKTVVVHEKETVVVKDKKDQGKHKGHYKNKKKGRK